MGEGGLSEVSGRPIPLEWLEALPWATTAVDDPAQP
jgi:RNA polymerase-binding transcription factor DksA